MEEDLIVENLLEHNVGGWVAPIECVVCICRENSTDLFPWMMWILVKFALILSSIVQEKADFLNYLKLLEIIMRALCFPSYVFSSYSRDAKDRMFKIFERDRYATGRKASSSLEVT